MGGGLGEGEPERVSEGAGPGQPLQLERGHLLEGGDRGKVCHINMAIDKFLKLTSAKLSYYIISCSCTLTTTVQCTPPLPISTLGC